jgi:hypothetical protein
VEYILSQLDGLPNDATVKKDQYDEDEYVTWKREETDDEYANSVCKSIINKRNANKQKAARQSKERAEYERLKKKYG